MSGVQQPGSGRSGKLMGPLWTSMPIKMGPVTGIHSQSPKSILSQRHLHKLPMAINALHPMPMDAQAAMTKVARGRITVAI
eukprot:scaffold662473_cov51-Prasinocladus_malaysianus.AAC.1